jgi:alginate O-acetyltransferase complex protein AlgI
VLFPTIDFAVFFVVVFTASWALRPWPRAWKWMILVASFIFYGWWDWRFVFLLAASVVINQGGAALVGRLGSDARRRWAMIGTVVADVGLLGWFKYYGFFSVNVANGLHQLGVGAPLPILQVALPVGISFFTFMGISYVVDVYRGTIGAAGWLDGAVYLTFFPHLVAGPIVRGSELLPQLRERRDPRRIDASRAAWLIMAGLAKKVVISSFLASHIVDPVFALPHQHSALEVLFAIYGYAIQIYADFSGYTDIAIGIALLLGFRFPDNFNAPYAAESMQDFWRRWHMTLSSWLRDYLYIPLGGNRGPTWRTALNIFLTMLIAGLWHGAAWTFVAWGAYHGIAQVTGMLRRKARATSGAEVAEGGGGGVAVASRVAAPERTQAQVWVSRIVTFHLVCLGWVLFRAESFSNAMTVLSRLAHWGPAPMVTPLVVGAIVVSIASQYVDPRTVARLQGRFSELAPVAQGALLAGGLYLITLLSPPGVAPFIYYRF